jgi:hypothetical protein
LAILAFAPVTNGLGVTPLWIQALSPQADYTVPTQRPNTSQEPQQWPEPHGEENIFSHAGVTRGRFVDPNRDALVALTKVSVGPGLYDECRGRPDYCISWALQEITFTTPSPTPDPKTLPIFTFSAPIVNTGNAASHDSPGAIAAGDFDKAIDPHGNYHDEMVMVTEYYDGPVDACAQKHTVLHNVLSDHRLPSHKTACQGIF